MRPESKRALLAVCHEVKPQTVWEWAEENVDFGLEPAYDTPLHGPYSADYLPMFKEIAACDTDPSVRECWVWKCARAGASENLLLNGIRYHVAVDPMPTLYVSGDIVSVERFIEERIKPGLRCSRATAKKFAEARVREYEIYFPDMHFVATWPSNKMAFKQSGWARVYIDEFSLVKDTTPGMLRKRTDTYAFSYICGVSSSDPASKRAASEDPILVEFKNGTMHEWLMADPKTGNKFRFAMGGEELPWGLKWDKTAKHDDGRWDIEKVRLSAYYVTPDGTRIDEAERMAVVRNGHWEQTRDAPPHIRSYRIPVWLLPFRGFGDIAVGFLQAHERGPQALKVFVMEWLAEEWREQIESTDDEEIRKRCGTYEKAKRISEEEPYKKVYLQKQKATFVTADVQKLVLYTVAREWIDGGDSGLIEYRGIPTWEEFDDWVTTLKATQVYIDNGYERRKMEVYEYCLSRGGIPTVGSESLAMPYKRRVIDPYEGKVGQGRYSLAEYTFHTDIFKSILIDMVNGRSDKAWFLYRQIEREYVNQVASEERVNGEWLLRHGHAQNHLWDCEVLQLLAATVDGLYHSQWVWK